MSKNIKFKLILSINYKNKISINNNKTPKLATIFDELLKVELFFYCNRLLLFTFFLFRVKNLKTLKYYL